MAKKSKQMFLILWIAILLYGIIQCFIPIVYFEMDKEDLEVKISEFCNENFQKNFNAVVMSIDNTDKCIKKVKFVNSLENQSSGEAMLVKTVLNRYHMTDLHYIRNKNTNFYYEYKLRDSGVTIGLSLFICFALVLVLLHNKGKRGLKKS